MTDRRGARQMIVIAWLTAIRCGGPAGQASVRQTLDLHAARRILAMPGKERVLGNIDLSGLEFSREFDVGDGIRVIAIATSLAGGLATFGPDGSAIATIPTGKIVSIQLFDLDEDDVSEVVLDEVDGKGTGVVSRSFVLYLVGRDGIREAWRRPSYRSESLWDPGKPSPAPTVQTRNFLRFDPGGSGRPPRLAYLLEPRGSCRFRDTLFELRDRRIHDVVTASNRSAENGACK